MTNRMRTALAAFLAVSLYGLATSPLLDAAVSRIKTWSDGQTLTAADLNAEFNNILNNGEDLGWPATKAKDLNAFELVLDGDGDTSVTADTDDRVDFRAGGQDIVRFDGTTASSVNFLDLASRATGAAPVIKSRGEANVGLVLQDSNGNEALVLGSTASAVNEITITNKATGAAPTIGSSGEADTGLALLDSNGNEALILGATASAVNEVTIANAATTARPKISVTGETDVGLDLQAKGAGVIQLLDGNGNEVLKTAAAVASAVNELTVTNAATGNPVAVSATGGDTDIGINLVPKGAGTVQIAGTAIRPAPIAGSVQSPASGTAIDFTSIPSWAQRIVVQFAGVSSNGTDAYLIQIGDSGGIEATGYLAASSQSSASVNTTNSTAGFPINVANAAAIHHGSVTLTLINPATFEWVATGAVARSDLAAMITVAGSKALSAALDRIRITTTGGTNEFDAGSVNILYD